MAYYSGMSASLRNDRECPSCRKSLKCPEGVQDHMLDKHGKFYCYLCNEDTFESNTKLKEHMKADHGVVRHRGYGKKRGNNKKRTLSTTVTSPTPPGLKFPMAEFLKLSPTELNSYIANHLQPTEEYNKFSKTIVDDLVNFLQHNTGLKVNSVVKGGSFGKGTHLKDNADLDCVLLLNDIKGVEDMVVKGDGILDKLENKLKQSTWADKIEIGYRDSPFGLQFDVTIKGREKMAVDLCPIFKVLDQVSSKEKDAVVFKKIMKTSYGSLDETERRLYSTALTKYQVDFVSKQNPSVKNLIRLVKHWNKTVVKKEAKSGLKYPKSYQYELVTIRVWEKAGSPLRFDMASAFKAVLKKLVDYRTIINVYWTDYYSASLACEGLKGMAAGPKLLDPSNPMDNVIERYYPEALDDVANIATSTLKAPLLQGTIMESVWL